MKLIRKIVNYLNKDVPDHPIETYDLLKSQLEEKYQLESSILVHFHNNVDYEDRKDYDKKMTEAIIGLNEKADININISENVSCISADYDVFNGFTAFTKYNPKEYIDFKTKG